MVASGTRGVSTRSLAWTGLNTTPRLERNQVHIWFLDIENVLNGKIIPSVQYGLSSREIARARKILDHGKRQLYLGGRAGLRYLLQQYTGIAAADINFKYGGRGKPWIEYATANGNLNFNYTVSSGYALYAFSPGIELGVDLEIFPRRIHSEGFARRIMSSAEAICWREVHHRLRDRAMLACWTRKEAYGKLLGVGIRFNMHQVTLFTDLHRDSWCTPVCGLFDGEVPGNVAEVCGVQLALPVPGAASLMHYHPASAVNGEDTRSKIAPKLLAFQLQPASDNV